MDIEKLRNCRNRCQTATFALLKSTYIIFVYIHFEYHRFAAPMPCGAGSSNLQRKVMVVTAIYKGNCKGYNTSALERLLRLQIALTLPSDGACGANLCQI